MIVNCIMDHTILYQTNWEGYLVTFILFGRGTLCCPDLLKTDVLAQTLWQNTFSHIFSVISVSKYTNSPAYKRGWSAQYSACLYHNLISKRVFYQSPTLLPYSLSRGCKGRASPRGPAGGLGPEPAGFLSTGFRAQY